MQPIRSEKSHSLDNGGKHYGPLTFDTRANDETVSLFLSKNVRIVVDNRLGYARLSAGVKTADGERRMVALITEKSLVKERLDKGLAIACRQIAKDITEDRAYHPELDIALTHCIAVQSGKHVGADFDEWQNFMLWDEGDELLDRFVRERLPVENWLMQIVPASKWPIKFIDQFDFSADDGRFVQIPKLLPGERQQTVEVWPNLRLLLEDQGRFLRLSLYVYHGKGEIKQTVLATSDSSSEARVRLRAGEVIDHYRDTLNDFPRRLQDRLPYQQWSDALAGGVSRNRPEPSDNDLLVTERTRGRRNVDSLARWAISPSVMLAFQERVDRPALFLITRPDVESKKFVQRRLFSIPISLEDIKVVEQELVDAVLKDVQEPLLDRGDFQVPLIEVDALRRKPGKVKDNVRKAVCAIPLESMLTIHDHAVLCMRRNGHKQPTHPEYSTERRFISHAGPHNRTAVDNAWWVLVGNSRDGIGKLFAWNGDSYMALDDAKDWRDEMEELKISLHAKTRHR